MNKYCSVNFFQYPVALTPNMQNHFLPFSVLSDARPLPLPILSARDSFLFSALLSLRPSSLPCPRP